MSWRAGFLGAVAFIAATAWIQTTPASAKDTFTIDLVNEPSSLDPQVQWNPDSYYVYRNIFDNLVTRDDAGEFAPEVASAWDVQSDTKIAFTIRDDIHFHDGTTLTPEDVVFSVKRITDPDFASPQLGQFNKIVDAEVTGPHTVVLTTDGPYPALLAQLVKLSIVPEHVVKSVGNDEFNLHPIGSGPYKFERVAARRLGDADPQRRLLGQERPLRDRDLSRRSGRVNAHGRPAGRGGGSGDRAQLRSSGAA